MPLYLAYVQVFVLDAEEWRSYVMHWVSDRQLLLVASALLAILAVTVTLVDIVRGRRHLRSWKLTVTFVAVFNVAGLTSNWLRDLLARPA